MTVYRRCQVPGLFQLVGHKKLKDVNRSWGVKNEDSAKVNRSFGSLVIFPNRYDHCRLSDVGGLSGEKRLSTLFLAAKFDVEGEK